MRIFSEIKQEIDEFGLKHKASAYELKRVYESTNIQELSQVIKDDFMWYCQYYEDFAPILEKYEDEFKEEEIFINAYTNKGYLLVCGDTYVKAHGNTTVYAYGNTTVYAYGSTTVYAFGNTTIRAFGNTTVYAFGNTTVYAHDNTTIRAFGDTTVYAFGNTTIRAHGKTTVNVHDNTTVYAFGNTTVYAFGNTTVYAYDDTYIITNNRMECKLNKNAIMRCTLDNSITYSNTDMKIKIQ